MDSIAPAISTCSYDPDRPENPLAALSELLAKEAAAGGGAAARLANST